MCKYWSGWMCPATWWAPSSLLFSCILVKVAASSSSCQLENFKFCISAAWLVLSYYSKCLKLWVLFSCTERGCTVTAVIYGDLMAKECRRDGPGEICVIGNGVKPLGKEQVLWNGALLLWIPFLGINCEVPWMVMFHLSLNLMPLYMNCQFKYCPKFGNTVILNQVLNLILFGISNYLSSGQLLCSSLTALYWNVVAAWQYLDPSTCGFLAFFETCGIHCSIGSPVALPSHCGLVKSVYRQLNLSVKPLTGFLVCKSCKDEPDTGVESVPIKGILELARQTQHLPQPGGGGVSVLALEQVITWKGPPGSKSFCISPLQGRTFWVCCLDNSILLQDGVKEQ